MRKAVLTVALAVTISIVAGCGGSMFVNKDYVYESPPPRVRLAILPAPYEDPADTDTTFAILFEDSTRAQEIIAPADIRRKFADDPRLLEIMVKLGSAQYSQDELKKNPSVHSALSDEEFTYFRKEIGEPTLVLVPVGIGTKDMGMVTSGSLKMQLYDFRTGALIYDHDQSLNVNVGGKPGKQVLVLGLAAFAKQDYRKCFWDKFVGQ